MINRLIDSARTLDPNRNVAYVSNTLTKGFTFQRAQMIICRQKVINFQHFNLEVRSIWK
ncbi:MAG: hypothetical protein V4663_10835 [Bacteroidota bacterium]